MEQAKGQTIFKAFAFASKYAGEKAGSWAGEDNIVRVAQCEIPDSELAEALLEEQLRKFGGNTWLESRKEDMPNKQLTATGSQAQSGEWECGQWYTVYVCKYNEEGNYYYDCTEVGPICAYYVYIEGEPGGGGSGNPGYPGDDPGECDPQGTEPCFDGPGGSQPPPEPDPCEENDPPAYCENKCEDTGYNTLDAIATQLAMEIYWEQSFGPENSPLPPSQRDEKIIIINKDGDDYEFVQVEPYSVSSCHIRATISSSLLSNAVGILHTHPYAPGDTITDQRCLDFFEYDLEENNGQYPIYNANDVSSADEVLVMDTELPVYVMDRTNIRTIIPSQPGQYNSILDRCGF